MIRWWTWQHWFCSQKRAKFEPPMRAPTVCPTKSKFTWHEKNAKGSTDGIGMAGVEDVRGHCVVVTFNWSPAVKNLCEYVTALLRCLGLGPPVFCDGVFADTPDPNSLSILNGCTIHGWTTNCLSNTTEFHGTLTLYVMKKTVFFVRLSRKQTCAASNDRVLLFELTPIQN